MVNLIKKFLWNIQTEKYKDIILYKLFFETKERYLLYFKFEKTVLNIFLNTLSYILEKLKLNRISYELLINGIISKVKEFYEKNGIQIKNYIYIVEVYNNLTEDLLSYKVFFLYDDAKEYLYSLIQKENNELYADALRKYKTEINLHHKPFIPQVQRINEKLYVSENKTFKIVKKQY